MRSLAILILASFPAAAQPGDWMAHLRGLGYWERLRDPVRVAVRARACDAIRKVEPKRYADAECRQVTP